MNEAVIDWLLDGDPSIRWQVMNDLLDAPDGSVQSERSRVADEGWGAQLLSLQGDDGNWGGGVYSPKWTSTTYTLLLLRHLGVDPENPRVATAVERVKDRVVFNKRTPFFGYRGETCITGMVLALSSYFDHADDAEAAVFYLLGRQKRDGGWNCEHRSSRSSFNTTISVLEGLLEYERAVGGYQPSSEARHGGHEYFLQRGMMRSLSTGELVNKRWTLFSFPPRWHYDVLRGLDYLRDAGIDPDPRCEESVNLVESKQTKEGSWPLQNHHRGREHFQMEDGPRKPSRWNTLRAMRVLRWHRGSTG